MFRKLNKKGQNTAEYALLISLVVAAIIAMQTYAQRALQGRIRDASQYLASGTSDLGTSVQYEPYYLSTNYTIDRNSTETLRQGTNESGKSDASNRIRETGGYQASAYSRTLGAE